MSSKRRIERIEKASGLNSRQVVAVMVSENETEEEAKRRTKEKPGFNSRNVAGWVIIYE